MNQLDAETLKLFDLLLAYHDDELTFVERLQVERLLNSDPRCGIHLDSLKYLDLEREIAVQDGEDLRTFNAARAGRCCQVLAKLEADGLSPEERQTLELEFQENAHTWADEILNCALCRRLRRRKLARQLTKSELPEGEPLLREWLLEEYYIDALESKVCEIAAFSDRSPGNKDDVNCSGRLQIVLARGSAQIRALRGANAEFHVQGNMEREFAGFICRSRRPEDITGLRPALLDEGQEESQSALELHRSLKDNLGHLTIRLVEASILKCKMWISLDSGPVEPVTLNAQIQGNQLLNLDASKGNAGSAVFLGTSEALEGQTLEIEIRRGGQVLESFQFTFSV